MATVIINDEEFNVANDSQIIDLLEECGGEVECLSGRCGACEVTILEGMENLNDLTKKEENFGLRRNRRLGCQLIIKEGTVKIEL